MTASSPYLTQVANPSNTCNRLESIAIRYHESKISLIVILNKFNVI